MGKGRGVWVYYDTQNEKIVHVTHEVYFQNATEETFNRQNEVDREMHLDYIRMLGVNVKHVEIFEFPFGQYGESLNKAKEVTFDYENKKPLFEFDSEKEKQLTKQLESTEDFLVDLDFRMSMAELGI